MLNKLIKSSSKYNPKSRNIFLSLYISGIVKVASERSFTLKRIFDLIRTDFLDISHSLCMNNIRQEQKEQKDQQP